MIARIAKYLVTPTLFTRIGFWVLVAVGVSQVACNTGEIARSIQLGIAAVEVATPFIQKSGASPEVLSASIDYLRSANAALFETTKILESTDSAALQAAKITKTLSAVAAAKLPAGTPQSIADQVTAVASSMETILKIFAPNGKMAAAGPGRKLNISDGDRAKIAKGKLKLQKNAEALKKS